MVASDSYHCKINLYARRGPQLPGIPRLIPRRDKTTPDEVCPYRAGGGDDDAETEQYYDAETLLQGQLQTHDKRNREDSDLEVAYAVDDACNQRHGSLVHAL